MFYLSICSQLHCGNPQHQTSLLSTLLLPYLFSYSCLVAHDPSALTDISETGKCDTVTVCAYALQEWVVLGQVDVEKLIEMHLNSVQDWERNFKALKVRGKDSERLPRYM